jgi:hypothetical protein
MDSANVTLAYTYFRRSVTGETIDLSLPAAAATSFTTRNIPRGTPNDVGVGVTVRDADGAATSFEQSIAVLPGLDSIAELNSFLTAQSR